MATDSNAAWDALDDFERSLSKKNTGDGFYVVEEVRLRWLGYDEERDGMFLTDERLTLTQDATQKEG